jgi:hypothetical protein
MCTGAAHKASWQLIDLPVQTGSLTLNPNFETLNASSSCLCTLVPAARKLPGSFLDFSGSFLEPPGSYLRKLPGDFLHPL